MISTIAGCDLTRFTDLGLDCKDIFLMAALYHLHSEVMINEDYDHSYIFSYKEIMDTMPILNLGKRAIRDRMAYLRDQGIITFECVKDFLGTRCYYGFTRKFVDLTMTVYRP